MKLSEKLRQDHECGDFGKALEGYAEEAAALEARVAELETFVRRIAERPCSDPWSTGCGECESCTARKILNK